LARLKAGLPLSRSAMTLEGAQGALVRRATPVSPSVGKPGFPPDVAFFDDLDRESKESCKLQVHPNLSTHKRIEMNTVESALAQKSGALIRVGSGDMVIEALRQMRDNRVRSVLVIDDDKLVGIVTQGDCAIKVLLPGLDAKQTPVSQVMTRNPVTVKRADQLEACMGLMAARGFRHLPVLEGGKVVGVISIGDVVKDIIRELERSVGDLRGYIMTDGPGG
jgi:CBS domain-containing protein